MVKRKKKPGRVILYKKFLEEKVNREKIETVQTSEVIVNKKEKEVKENTIPYSIAICSLGVGCGCSHLTLALANYLKKRKKRVFVITKNPALFIHIPSGSEFIEGDYDHILYDIGYLYDLEIQGLKQVELCQGKIMVCINNDIYLKKLANFIESKIKFTQSWFFLFNFVTEKKEKEVVELMEDYKFGTLPLFDPNEDMVVNEIIVRAW